MYSTPYPSWHHLLHTASPWQKGASDKCIFITFYVFLQKTIWVHMSLDSFCRGTATYLLFPATSITFRLGCKWLNNPKSLQKIFSEYFEELHWFVHPVDTFQTTSDFTALSWQTQMLRFRWRQFQLNPLAVWFYTGFPLLLYYTLWHEHYVSA